MTESQMNTPEDRSRHLEQLLQHYERLRRLHGQLSEHLQDIESELLALEELLPDLDHPDPAP